MKAFWKRAEAAIQRLLCILIVTTFVTLSTNTVYANSPNTAIEKGLQQSEKNVEGTVKDPNGEPLIGVSVIIEGTTTGTNTDVNGHYSLKVRENTILIFSYMGYKTTKVKVTQNIHQIIMDEDIRQMDEVIVVGYGVMKKSDVTGAISSVNTNAIARQPVANIVQALQGNAPGVMVTANSGAPGGSINVRIRGIGTVNNSDPLYVVDGMPVENVDYLSSADIQAMEVLKDASSTAIYGARGANGVILVTTKQGSIGKPVITLDAYWGVNKVIDKTDLMNGSQWYDLHTEINKVRESEGVKILDLSKVDRNTSTNWLKEVTRSAFQQNYGLGISGGATDDYLYNFGINYIDQEGTIRKTDYTRLSFRQNIQKTLVKKILTIGTNFNYSQSTAHRVLEESNTVGIINTAIKLEPIIPVRNNDGSYGSSPYIDYPNPVAAIEYTNNKRKISSLVGNVFLEFKPIKDITFKSSFGADIRKTDDYEFDPSYYVSSYQNNPVNKVYRGYIKKNYYVWENTVSYLKKFADKHTINAVVGYSNEWGKLETLAASARGTATDIPEVHFIDSGLNKLSHKANGIGRKNTLISYLGRVHYDFDDRYLLTVSFRRDGSSKFAKDHRWGNFPSLALGWKISNEQFFKNLDWQWVSSLKFRGGWGKIGNQNIDDYTYYNLLSGNGQYAYLFGKNGNETLHQGLAVVKLGNPNVKWETTETVNIGMDANFLDGRLIFSGEYYNKKTKDMLLVEPLPLYLGYEEGPQTNIGNATNRGVEFNIEWRDKIGNVNYNLGFNISTVRNRMTNLGAGLPITGGSIRNGNATLTKEGYPIGAFYGYKTNGLIQDDAQLAEVRTRQPNAQLGDVVFVDTNEDKELTAADRTMIGNPIPDFTYGINVGAEWKGIDINLQFGGVHGNKIFNAMRYFTHNLADGTNKDVALLNYWTPTNKNTNIPRLVGKDSNDNMRISDRYIEGGSYFRLRNMQIGYTLPKELTRKFYIQKLRVFVTGQNLFTVTNYSGPDPEVGQLTTGQTTSNTLSRGVDIGTYPQARTFTGGISVTF